MTSEDDRSQRLLKSIFGLMTGTFKHISNEERIKNFNREFKNLSDIRKDKTYIQKNITFTSDSKVGSIHKTFNPKMKSITIKEMELHEKQEDKYIKLEIVTELIMMVGVAFLGKDENGDLITVAVYNYENHYGTKDYDKLSYIFKKGKHIMILEPYYKVFANGEDGIRIEDPNEIIIFDDKEWMNKFIKTENKEESFKILNDENDKNYDSLYKEAYKSFAIENYKMALIHFIKLKTIKPEEKKFDMKIAECYFNIPYYSKVIEKCDELLSLNKNDINNEQYILNALSLKLKSLLKLKRVKEAKNVIENNKYLIIKNASQFYEIEEEIKNKMKNINGEFDLGELYEKSKNNFNIDIGEYISNKIEIRKDKIKGLSIYTKNKINKGEIIIVSKAIIASNLKKEKNEKYIQYDSPDEEEYEKTGKILISKENDELQNKLSYNISNYPDDYKEFLYLFDGKNININLEDRLKMKEIDLKRIQRIFKYNSKILIFNDIPIPLSEGIWFYPSLFNHSCLPNCFQFGFGDILIIIAINDIEENNELNINYLNDDNPFYIRQKILKEKYDFICNCELCNYEKNKFKNCPEKIILNKYITKLFNCFSIEDEKEMKYLTEKEIKEIIKFTEKNKKLFSCYEKSFIYIYCFFGMKLYDIYLANEYLEKALKYNENRNYEYEKLTLKLLIQAAIFMGSFVRYEMSFKALKEFYERYFPNQKKSVNILVEKYRELIESPFDDLNI